MKSFNFADIDTLLRIYYQYNELSNALINEVFGGRIAKSTVTRLKKRAKEKEIELGKKTCNCFTVNTEAAYAAWGLDVNDLERRRKKLQQLGLYDMSKEAASI